LLRDLPLTLPWQHPDTSSSWHLYVVRLQLDRIGKTHRQVFEELRATGIDVNLHYIPVHTQPYYQQFSFKIGDFPKTEKYYAEALSLPLFYELTDANQKRITKTLKNVLV